VLLALAVAAVGARGAHAQDAPVGQPPPLVHPPAPAGAPPLITLQDAIERARQNDAQFQAIAAEAEVAREDRVQAKASLLPALSNSTQFLGNSANGVNPNGRFVSLDGVQMYREWLVLRQEVSASTFMRTPLQRAQAAQLAAEARREVAARGLVVTVTRLYYGLVSAERKYATAQQAVQQSARFLAVTRQQEQAGQVARADVVKAEIQFRQQSQGFQEATLAMANARLALAVLLFPTLDENFTVVDEVSTAPQLPPFADVRAMAARGNPDLRAADEALRAAEQDVRAARNAFFPTLLVDAVYGIEANEFALHSAVAAQPEYGVLPNLGYFLTLNLSVPLWDWGALRSKLHQTETRARQARVTLSQTQRQLVGNLYSMYNEVVTARAALDNLQRTAELAAESLRLGNLRYQAGEATALEVVDAQNTLVQARNAADEAVLRYRVALAALQSVTGSF
jgi:outer membrane protein TolC